MPGAMAIPQLARGPAPSPPETRGADPVKQNFGVINAAKANFDEIYDSDDPRSYFSVLGSLDYMIPDVAEPVVRQILQAYRRRHDVEPEVLDVGCSYGINAAVHRFPVTFAGLRRRYARREMAALSAAELANLDKNYYASWPDTGLATFVGLDTSLPAIQYAKRVGLLADGIAANLEEADPSPTEEKLLSGVDIVLSTGSVGYVSEKTYRRVLACTPRPWIVSFVLRMFPYDSFAKLFDEHGLVTERLPSAVFVQRRFRDLEEFESSLEMLGRRGLDTEGFESDGLLQADLFVSRPAADVMHQRLTDMITVSSGKYRPTGTRYVEVSTADGRGIALEP
jgi:SAM-dependent methyltransferase